MRAALAVAAILVATVTLPASAAAHAVLTHSTPHRGATVSEAPPAVVFDFNEPVEVSFGALRVYDEQGRQVDEGGIVRPNDSPRSVGVKVGSLSKGLYTATFRVVSADGHPVSGGFTFGVGVAVARGGSAPDVAELLAETDAGPEVEGTYGVARGLHYAALLLFVGAVAFALYLWPVGSTAPWPRRLLVVGAAVGLLTALAGVGLQGALAAGGGLADAVDGDVIDASLDTRTGEGWAIRAVLWLGVLVVAALMHRPAFAPAAFLTALTAALVVSLPLFGHADTQDPQALLVPADVLHVAAAGTWLGGLVLLLVVFLRRTDHPEAQSVTAKFSGLALPAVIAIVLAGTTQAWFYLDGPKTLFTSTYGLALLAKILLVTAIVAFAQGNRRRARTGTDPVRRAMRAEVVLAVVVLAATAVLVRAQPPASEASGPANVELDLGPMRLEMVIEPATTGPNDFHLYLFDRRTGAQIDRVEEMVVSLRHPEKDIGPIRLPIPRKGPAHYEKLDEALGVPGTWEVRVQARVNDFDAYESKDEIEVREP